MDVIDFLSFIVSPEMLAVFCDLCSFVLECTVSCLFVCLFLFTFIFYKKQTKTK